jgi:hypothetical protein
MIKCDCDIMIIFIYFYFIKLKNFKRWVISDLQPVKTRPSRDLVR